MKRGHGDYVWEQGTFSDPPACGLESWFVRGGSAGAAASTFRNRAPAITSRTI